MSESEEDYEAVRRRNIAEMRAAMQKVLEATKEEREELNRLAPIKPTAEPQKKKQRKPWVKRTPIFFRTYETRNSAKRVEFEEESAKRVDDEEESAKENKPIKKHFTRGSVRKVNKPMKEHDFFDENADEISMTGAVKIMFLWSSTPERKKELDSLSHSIAEGSNQEEEDDDLYVPYKVKAKHKKNKRKIISESSSDSEDLYSPDLVVNEKPMRKKKKIENMSREIYDLSTVLQPDDITQEMLDSVANRSMEKEHDPVDGTSCHQCRQKTKDFKTVCRSGRCSGVRGSFCGPCLRGRYGESAVEALKDPNWECPVCRGICNCSIHFRQQGKEPTGILVPTVMREGYKSVKDYVQAQEDEVNAQEAGSDNDGDDEAEGNNGGD